MLGRTGFTDPRLLRNSIPVLRPCAVVPDPFPELLCPRAPGEPVFCGVCSMVLDFRARSCQ